MLTIFASALIAFLYLAWDKATGIGAEEKHEIGNTQGDRAGTQQISSN